MEFYSRTVLDHFMQPQNSGEIPGAHGSSSLCLTDKAATFRFDVNLADGKVVCVRFLTQGCVASIACSSALTVIASGLYVEEALGLTEPDLVAFLDGMPSSRHFCVEAALRCFKAALAQAMERTGVQHEA